MGVFALRSAGLDWFFYEVAEMVWATLRIRALTLHRHGHKEAAEDSEVSFGSALLDYC